MSITYAEIHYIKPQNKCRAPLLFSDSLEASTVSKRKKVLIQMTEQLISRNGVTTNQSYGTLPPCYGILTLLS